MSEFPIAQASPKEDFWPELPLERWRDTYAALHMWTQVVGKIRLVQTPLINHWWEVPLYVTSRGLTTSTIPHGGVSLQIDFDFCSHRLILATSEGKTHAFSLRPMTVSAFYQEVMEGLFSLGTPVSIWTRPVEVENPIPFEEDQVHRSYDAKYVWRCFQILVLTEQVFIEFRSRFLGKNSPVHFFWGGFDLAVTRFSGRPAPEHPPTPLAPKSIVREAYSHEVYSCGFWPGNDIIREAAFYAYAYPEPEGFKDAPIEPQGAFYSRDLGEFILPYEHVRLSEKPRETLLRFLETTYEAAARHGGWDREALERKPKHFQEVLAGEEDFLGG
jgi:hypothetical protein